MKITRANLVGGYANRDLGVPLINESLPLDHVNNNVLFLECSENSNIIGFDVDEPDSPQAQAVRDRIDWDRDIISYNSKDTLEDVKNGLGKFKVFFEFHGVGHPKNKNNKNVEVFYAKARANVVTRHVAFNGLRWKDKHSYVVHNIDKELRYLPFEPQDVLSHKTKLTLLGVTEKEIEEERINFNVDVEDGEIVYSSELEELLDVLKITHTKVVKSKDDLLTFKCLFPHHHTDMNNANAYAYKKDGVYQCRCHGSVCRGAYDELNKKLAQATSFDLPDVVGVDVHPEKVTLFQAPTGWGKTENLAKTIVSAIKNNEYILILMQNIESIDRLLQRVDYYSNQQLATMVDSEKLSVFISETRDNINEQANVIVSHHYYYLTQGTTTRYNQRAYGLLGTVQRDLYIDEAHTFVELITRTTFNIGGVYKTADVSHYSEQNRMSIERVGNNSFMETLSLHELSFRTDAMELKFDEFSNIELFQKWQLYNSVNYVDMFKIVNNSFEKVSKNQEDNYVYTVYRNPNVQTPKPHIKLDKGARIPIQEILLDSSDYAIVSMNVGDDVKRKQFGDVTLCLQHVGLMKLLFSEVNRVTLLSATFSDYHKYIVKSLGYETVEKHIEHKIDKVKNIVVLSADANKYKDRKAIFSYLNTQEYYALLFIETISKAYSYMSGLDNAMLNDNGKYVIGARKDSGDFVDNYKRTMTFAGLESSVAKGYNYMEEIDGDGFEIVYFNSPPVSPPLIKKYIRDGELVDYNYDYIQDTYAQAIGRAFRKNKETLVVLLNNLKDTEPLLIEYLENTTQANIIEGELNLTNMQIALKESMEEFGWERAREVFGENPIFQALYMNEEKESEKQIDEGINKRRNEKVVDGV